MATRKDLQELARLRLEEAEALFAAGLYDGCAYLCGYVVELALKARICATLGVDEYPEKGTRLREAFRTHDFDDLKLLAGMEHEFSAARPALLSNWSIASKWKPERRYDRPGSYDRVQAEQILNAVRAKPDGVLECISSRWEPM
jgi:HEPN domain-containing protein